MEEEKKENKERLMIGNVCFLMKEGKVLLLERGVATKIPVKFFF